MDLSGLRVGIAGEAALVVDESRTALALGSGSVPVFGTPAMVALMEKAAAQCVEQALPAGAITLGTEISVEHVAATALGARVAARAELTAIDGRVLRFTVTAHEGEKLIGRGTHTRAVVDRQRFMTKVGAPG
ncbi:MAG: thioesterase family protein [Hyphomicrobiaceae bacterium]|nr:thioesterase family protein [Hyphomicrobiaceae bacterium]